MFGLKKKKQPTLDDEISGLPAVAEANELANLDGEGADEEEDFEVGGDTSRDPIKIYTIVSSIIVVLLGAWILYTAKMVRDYKEGLKTAQAEYSEIYDLAQRINEHMDTIGGDRSVLEVQTGYFRQRAGDAGLNPNRTIREVQPKKSPKKGHFERSWRVTFNDPPLDRKALADYLYHSEANHPLLKATEVTLRGSNKPEDKEDLWMPTFKFAFHTAE